MEVGRACGFREPKLQIMYLRSSSVLCVNKHYALRPSPIARPGLKGYLRNAKNINNLSFWLYSIYVELERVVVFRLPSLFCFFIALLPSSSLPRTDRKVREKLLMPRRRPRRVRRPPATATTPADEINLFIR